jgi:hypothetical protein
VRPTVQQVFNLFACIVTERHEIFFLGHAGRPLDGEVDQTVPEARIIHQIYCDEVLEPLVP